MDPNEPTFVDETLISSAHSTWLAAIRDEMESMVRIYVWDLVDLLSECKSIENKLVLKIKRKADGLINKYMV